MNNVSDIAEDIMDPEHVDTHEYLTFCLGREYFGVDILKVQEIRAWEDVTRIPNAHAYIMGVINLRGSIVPVYDLRLRLGMKFAKYGPESVVIILRVIGIKGDRNIGIVVDEVSDVLLASSRSIKNAPDFSGKLDAEFISGITSAGDKAITLLLVDVLQPQEQRRQSN
jgi:purine-binding chemotaxis protein CheW